MEMKPSLNANTATKENLYKTVIPYRKTSVRNFFAYFKKFFERISHLTCYNRRPFIPVILAMLPLGTMTYDEISRWNFYVQCMPVEKKRIVSSKYLTVLMLALGGSVIVGCIKLIYDIAAGETDYRVIIMMIIVASVLALLVVSWMLSSVIYEHKEL